MFIVSIIEFLTIGMVSGAQTASHFGLIKFMYVAAATPSIFFHVGVRFFCPAYLVGVVK